MATSNFKSELEVPVPVDQLFSWHENPGAFERLTPPFDPVTIKGELKVKFNKETGIFYYLELKAS